MNVRGGSQYGQNSAYSFRSSKDVCEVFLWLWGVSTRNHSFGGVQAEENGEKMI